MEINPTYRANLTMPVNPVAKPDDQTAITRSVVSAVRAVNKAQLFGDNRELSFTRDRDTHKMVIRIVERQTGEVVEQIPPEQVLRMMQDLQPTRRAEKS